MTARHDFDRQLSAWLATQAPTREPEPLLGQVLARTSGIRRRAAWRIPERWLPMSAITSRLVPVPVSPRALVLALVLVAALIAGVVAVAGSYHPRPAPFGPAANGKIFYSEGGDILARDTGSGAAVPVVAGSEEDSDPVLSPDGSMFSFLRHVPSHPTQIWVANVDGSNRHRLATPEAEPGWFEWSPQSDVAAFVTDSDPTAITMLPANGGPATRHDIGIRSQSIAFRPIAGSQLAILGADPEGNRGVWLVNRDGTGLKRLDLDAGFRSDADYLANRDYYFWTMSWSPTGDRLLYTQLETVPRSKASPGFRTHLATVDAAGKVTSDRIIEFDPTADDELGATWFPSGDRLVFETKTSYRQSLSTATVGATGVGPAEALPVSDSEWIGIQVSPDGKQLLAVMPTASGSPTVVNLVDVASQSVTPVSLGTDAAWQRAAP